METTDGQIRARLTVGADGRKSTVARLLGVREYHVVPPGRIFAWGYFEGAQGSEGHIRLGSTGRLTYVASPTDSDLVVASVCPPFTDRAPFLADREGSFAAALNACPELAGLLADARRLGPIRVMANWRSFFRPAAGNGWALLGDAGNFKDPSPAQGIADALRQSERLAEAIVAGLGNEGTSLDDQLLRWWRWRDDDCFDMHWLAADMGRAGPPRTPEQAPDRRADPDLGQRPRGRDPVPPRSQPRDQIARSLLGPPDRRCRRPSCSEGTASPSRSRQGDSCRAARGSSTSTRSRKGPIRVELARSTALNLAPVG